MNSLRGMHQLLFLIKGKIYEIYPSLAFRFQFRKSLILAGIYPSFSFSHSLLSDIDAQSF